MSKLPRLPRILITNDDGIDAPGIAILEEVAKNFTDDLWVIAPEFGQSGASQAITLAEPVKITKRDDRHFAIRGTPSDCVIVALSHLMKDDRPNILISGINRGTNHGDAINFSGTVGAALTGLMFDLPSIAISQFYCDRTNVPWETSREITPKLLEHFLIEGWKKDTCLSINIPDLPAKEITGMNWARQTPKTLGMFKVTPTQSPRDETFAWLQIIPSGIEAESADMDDSVLRRGKVSVSAITLDRSLEVLKPSVRFTAPPTEQKHTDTKHK